jgi:hypothetical protein
MQNFQINTLIQFLTSSTTFERHGFILRKTAVFAFFSVECLIHRCKQSSRWQSVLDTSCRSYVMSEGRWQHTSHVFTYPLRISQDFYRVRLQSVEWQDEMQTVDWK